MPDEDARDRRGDDEQPGEEPRPERRRWSAPRRRLVGRAAAARHRPAPRGAIIVAPVPATSAASAGARMICVAESVVAARDRRAAQHALEVGLHLLGALVARRRVLRERAHHDHVEVARDVAADLRRRLGRRRQVLHRDLDRRVAVERRLAGEELVEDDAERVEIGALVDLGAARLLGREVLRRADDRARLGHLARAGARDPEVGHLDAAFAVDEDVVRLDVAVDDPVPVREARARRGSGARTRRDVDRRRAAADDELLQRAPVEVLHRDVVRVLGLAAVVDRDDVRMVERGGVLRLAAEPLDELLVVRVAVVEDLDRDAAAELLILREVDVGHPAGAELADDLVAPVEERVDEGVARGHGPPTA